MDISLAISGIAIIVSMMSVFYSVVIAKKANSLQIMIDLFREFRSYEFKEASRYVIENLEKDCDPKDGYWQLKVDSRKHVLKVSHFFNNVGALVSYGIVEEDLIIGYMSITILMVWDKLYPFLENERARRFEKYGFGIEYQEHFEDLVCRAKKKPLSVALKNKFKLQKLSDLERINRAPGYNDPMENMIQGNRQHQLCVDNKSNYGNEESKND